MLIGNSFGENKTGASFIRGNEYFSKQNDEIKEKAVKGTDKTPKQVKEQDPEEEDGQIGTSSATSEKEDPNESQPEENDP